MFCSVTAFFLYAADSHDLKYVDEWWWIGHLFFSDQRGRGGVAVGAMSVAGWVHMGHINRETHKDNSEGDREQPPTTAAVQSQSQNPISTCQHLKATIPSGTGTRRVGGRDTRPSK